MKKVAAALAFVTSFGQLAQARAHFTLEEPASWMSQDTYGSPQKLGPCGDEGGGTETGLVTGVARGSTISITIDEKIFHPGHYRVAIAADDPSGLPAEPPVTAASSPCGSTTVQDPPVFPVLADGVLDHATPFDGPQTFEVTLPADLACDRCTLQVIQFMSDHGLNDPGGCFYHHCATLSIAANGGGATATSGGDEPSSASESGGCGCAVPAQGSSALAALCGVALLLAAARRRRGSPLL